MHLLLTEKRQAGRLARPWRSLIVRVTIRPASGPASRTSRNQVRCPGHRTRRLTRPADGAVSTVPQESSPEGREPLLSRLTRASRLTDVSRISTSTRSTSPAASAAVRVQSRKRRDQATSFGLEELLTDPWLPDPPEHSLVSEVPAARLTLVADAARQMPELTRAPARRPRCCCPCERDRARDSYHRIPGSSRRSDERRRGGGDAP